MSEGTPITDYPTRTTINSNDMIIVVNSTGAGVTLITYDKLLAKLRSDLNR